MIIYQKIIKREDLRANPDVLYVFGDNIVRQGYGGQAGEMRGEPNAVGIATKVTPDVGKYSFFTDDDYEKALKFIHEDMQPVFDALEDDKIVVVPLDGIGTGLADLPNKAPKVYKYICELGLGAQRDNWPGYNDPSLDVLVGMG
jgi:hypothetical protein